MTDLQIKVLKDFYASINDDNFSASRGILCDDIVRVEPEGYPLAGTFKGIDKLMELMKRARGTWAEGGCTPVDFIEEGKWIIAVVKIHVRLKNETNWIDGEIGDVFTFRDDKIAEFRTIDNKEEALAWAKANP